MHLEGHRMTKLRFLFVVLCGVLMAPGLAAAKEDSGEGDANVNDRKGFFVSQFRNFRAIDNRHAVRTIAQARFPRDNIRLLQRFAVCRKNGDRFAAALFERAAKRGHHHLYTAQTALHDQDVRAGE